MKQAAKEIFNMEALLNKSTQLHKKRKIKNVYKKACEIILWSIVSNSVYIFMTVFNEIIKKLPKETL